MRNIFSISLRKYRQGKGLSQKQLAELLSKETNLEFAARHISSYEANNVYPKGDFLPVLAKILDVSLDDLFGVNVKSQKVDISDIIGLTRPELNNLSKSELKMVFEKYLNYLDELIKSRELLVEKVHHLEAQIQLLKQESAEGPNNE